MPAKSSQSESGGFSAEERAAMKERAAELRAEGKKGAKKADGLQQVLDRIAEMAPEDRALAERVHVTVTTTAPQLAPKTWYGMPSYANADGKIVVFFQDAGKFSYRYSTLGFQDSANLDDGYLWPVSFALKKWSPAVEKKVVQLVRGQRRPDCCRDRRAWQHRWVANRAHDAGRCARRALLDARMWHVDERTRPEMATDLR
jgi:uncharacterized protein YdhG (YjbR/CyaY superfamily)